MLHIATLTPVALLMLGPISGGSTQDDVTWFERRVRPLLATHCTTCHNADKRGGLRLDHGSYVQQGGDSGVAVIPGDVDGSRLIRAVRYDDVDLRMPPRGRLADEEIATLEEWVRRGAFWPDEPVPDDQGESQAFDLEGRRASHWAWSPLAPGEVPEVGDAAWPLDPLDHYVLAPLERRGLRPAAESDRRTWLRRVTFDLIGLPPSPDELRAFLADDADGAHGRVVDRLLESPHFGERWARHWLDLVRYAETYGHEFDYPIHHAYQYRDYVIRAMNADVPYDDFVREHLAGDSMDPPRRHPETGWNESVLGTGFWHMHQATHGPVDPRLDQAERVDNQIDVLSKTFLGLTVSCARCHDHKFDAIRTDDFYALAGIVGSTRRAHAYLDPRGEIAAGVQSLREWQARGTDELRTPLPSESLTVETAAAMLTQLRDWPAPPDEVTRLEAHAVKGREVTRGTAKTQDMKGYGDRWTGGQHLWWTGAEVGDRLTLPIEVAHDGRVDLRVAFTRAPDYGQVQVWLDGRPVGGAVEGYYPHVIPTGPISLGFHALTAGTHHIAFEVVGSHPRAVPKRMVGVDFLELRQPDIQADRLAERRAMADSGPLDEATLDRCRAAEQSSQDHPLRGLLALARATTVDIDAHAAAAPPRNSDDVVFEDFGGDDWGEWIASGEAFGDGPTQRLEWDLDRALQRGEVEAVTAGVASSGSLGRRLQGSLRSPSFVLTHKHIHYRVRGQGKVRLIIDGYFMDTFNGLLYAGLAFDLRRNDGFGWHDQRGDLGKYVGHRAHIELHDEGDGVLEVDEIRFSNEGPPASPDQSLTRAVARRLLETSAPATPDAALWAAAQLWVESAQHPMASDVSARLAPLARDLTEGRSPFDAWREKARPVHDALPRPTRALTAEEGSGWDEAIFIRGQHQNRGDVVPRRFLEALAGTEQEPVEWGSGRRELADRLLADQNPLPSRVAVNRVWHHLMGRGIVPTTDDFGVLGERPTHPELLDHLAAWFRGEGAWSRKALIRRLVLSRTYRMSSRLADVDPRALEQDPENTGWSRMRVRRLEGEALRDAMLALSGRLDRTMFGPSVGIHLTEFMQGRGRPGSGPRDGHGRRSVYVEVRRNFLSPMMLAFDTPLPHSTLGKRSVSNVPAQALILMNDPFVHEEAKRWGATVALREGSVAQRVEALYEEAFSRSPVDQEREAALAFLGNSPDASSWSDFCHVLFNVKEFAFVQ